jgi:short-subunit dehydrogenase
MESLKGKKIILTGATGGIGQATAQLLAASQAQLFLVGRNTEKLEALSQRLSGAPYYAIDLTQTDAIAELGQYYTAQYGVPDILIHTAGIGIIRPIEQLTEADFLLSLQTNLISTFCLLKAFLPGMKEVKKGLIVNIPGVLGKVRGLALPSAPIN